MHQPRPREMPNTSRSAEVFRVPSSQALFSPFRLLWPQISLVCSIISYFFTYLLSESQPGSCMCHRPVLFFFLIISLLIKIPFVSSLEWLLCRYEQSGVSLSAARLHFSWTDAKEWNPRVIDQRPFRSGSARQAVGPGLTPTCDPEQQAWPLRVLANIRVSHWPGFWHSFGCKVASRNNLFFFPRWPVMLSTVSYAHGSFLNQLWEAYL